MSLFDGYKKDTNAAVASIMGKVAVWVPSDGSAPAGITANVLFKQPTKEEKLNGVEFDPERPSIEIHRDTFPGLATSVRSGNTEHLTINGLRYLVENAGAKWDGDISTVELVIDPV